MRSAAGVWWRVGLSGVVAGIVMMAGCTDDGMESNDPVPDLGVDGSDAAGGDASQSGDDAESSGDVAASEDVPLVDPAFTWHGVFGIARKTGMPEGIRPSM